ncbi:MAG TPA: HNH endonuclease signature motif containing protein [Acidimicrobiales bacterium]|nr:HNH endonuclease signature motif containing protein [Acidimicrobiales bacterium]
MTRFAGALEPLLGAKFVAELLIVSKEAVDRGWVEPGEQCQTAEGDHLPMSAVDTALLDKDTLVQEVEVDVDVRSIRTMKKYIPKRLRDALEAKGVCCSVAGCGRTKNLEIDHTQERRNRGPTELANLGWLCPYHHDLKTRGLYRLWRDADGWHWEPTERARGPGTQRSA